MPLVAFDHINVRTAQLDAMVRWYADILGMHAGPRPAFSFPGAWLYLGDLALIHLVGVDDPPGAKDPGLEHFAIRATGLQDFLDHLQANSIESRVGEVPDIGVVQVNVHDPDGNHIHIDFAATERS